MKKLYFAAFGICMMLLACSSSSGKEDPGPVVTSNFRFHAFLQNGMVIQQNQPLRVWGRSRADAQITVTASWDRKTYTCKTGGDGTWTVDIPVPAAPSDNAPQTITASTSIQTETLSDLLIGEVWLLGGQSNMAFELVGVLNQQAEIAAADYPQIRFLTMYPVDAHSPEWEWHTSVPERYYKWIATTPETAGLQSGVGYYFGRMLHRELGVPIGLVNTSVGGATAQTYTPIEALEADRALKEMFVDPYKANPGMDMLVRPSVLYNSMVHPVLPASIRGVAWYQGEGNWGDYKIYPQLMKTLIDAWRRDFNRGQIPFYCVQIAPWALGTDNSKPEWFYSQQAPYFFIREAQTKVRDEVPNTGMAVTMDVGEADNIHPINKRPVGERLARLALNQTYGRTDIECLGPRYKSLKVESGVVKIAFDNAAGLATSDSEAPKYFYIASAAGASHVFHQTTAQIHGSEVWLTCPDVVTAATKASDIHVRYAMLMAPTTNLQNGAGLPAEPFRTDDWYDGVSYAY